MPEIGCEAVSHSFATSVAILDIPEIKEPRDGVSALSSFALVDFLNPGDSYISHHSDSDEN
jgi:hypothetical protein